MEAGERGARFSRTAQEERGRIQAANAAASRSSRKASTGMAWRMAVLIPLSSDTREGWEGGGTFSAGEGAGGAPSLWGAAICAVLRGGGPIHCGQARSGGVRGCESARGRQTEIDSWTAAMCVSWGGLEDGEGEAERRERGREGARE